MEICNKKEAKMLSIHGREMNYLRSFFAFSMLWTVLKAVDENQNMSTNQQRAEENVSNSEELNERKSDFEQNTISTNLKLNETGIEKASSNKSENDCQSFTYRYLYNTLMQRFSN